MDQKLKIQAISMADELWTEASENVDIYCNILFHGAEPIRDNLVDCARCIILVSLDAVVNNDQYKYAEDKPCSDGEMLSSISSMMLQDNVLGGYDGYVLKLEKIRHKIAEYCIFNMYRIYELVDKFNHYKDNSFKDMTLSDDDELLLYTCVAIVFVEANRRRMEVKMLEIENGS